MFMEDHNISAVLEQFRSQDRIFSNFYDLHAKGKLGEFIESLPDIKLLFQLNDRHFRCIDERTPGGLHAAGPLILMDEAKAIRLLRTTRAEGLYSHDGCGAAGLAFANVEESKRNFYVNSDNYGMFYAKELAKKAGIPYVGHLPAHPHFHVARMAVYDGSGNFDNSERKLKIAGLPPCFVISRRWHDAADAKNELGIAAKIATGDHGYGSLIKEKAPFLFLVVGMKNKDFSLHKLMDEASAVASEFAGKVIVDGFVAPV